tara:strand:- start:2701 stop:3435 length:735 start_codon:yes stop_codon:yes gene_type:complete
MNSGFLARALHPTKRHAMRVGLVCCSALTLSLTVADAQDVAEPGFGGAFWGFHLNHILSQDLDGSCIAVSGICPDESASFSSSEKGWGGGVLAGYNWEHGPMVVGLESDISFGNLNDDLFFNGKNSGTVTSDSTWSAGLRAKAGVLPVPDLWVYGIGGIAVSYFDDQLESQPFAGSATLNSLSEIYTGYSVGAGAELQTELNFRVSFDYLYTDFASQTVTQNGLTTRFDHDRQELRVGLKFPLN